MLTAADSWVQAGEPLEVAAAPARICELAMDIHGRSLGCRFGFDESRALLVQYDIYPEMTVGHVVAALSQLAYVGACMLPPFRRCLGGGQTITEEEIDLAFSVTTEAN